MASSSEDQRTASCQQESSNDKKSSEDEIELPKDFEPGASRVAVLLSTGSYEEESVSNEDFGNFHRKGSCISEIEHGVAVVDLKDSKADSTDNQEPEKNENDVRFYFIFSP